LVRGRQKSTPVGIERTIRDVYSSIVSMRVIHGSDSRFVRAETQANAVDVNQDRALDDEIEGFDLARSVDNASVDNLSITRLSRDPEDTTSTDVTIDFNEYARSLSANRAIAPM
jgi:uncharacterized membrane protein